MLTIFLIWNFKALIFFWVISQIVQIEIQVPGPITYTETMNFHNLSSNFNTRLNFALHQRVYSFRKAPNMQMQCYTHVGVGQN